LNDLSSIHDKTSDFFLLQRIKLTVAYQPPSGQCNLLAKAKRLASMTLTSSLRVKEPYHYHAHRPYFKPPSK